MLLRGISLRNFRNIASADLELKGRRQFFIGNNGQGKTNLLEAVGLLLALRSFRTSETGVLVKQGVLQAELGFRLEHEKEGDCLVRLVLSSQNKSVSVDQEKVGKLADYIGRFPVVVLSSRDLLLIRDAPGGRRRWLDLGLSATDPEYLGALQTYHKAMAARNALLKRDGGVNQLAAFERLMAPAAALLVARRSALFAEISALVEDVYRYVAQDGASLRLEYVPDMEARESGEIEKALLEGRTRDLRLKQTARGPHRDDFEFNLGGARARDVASEGQQRLLVIALKLAQVLWLGKRLGVSPLVLADDILVELDAERRGRFWEKMPTDVQLMATGTVRPDDAGGVWQYFRVDGGVLSEEAGGSS